MEDIVSFELAKKLKEKGFREKCLHHYNNNDILKENYSKCYCSANNIFTDNTVDAPTISQVLKWLREKNKIFVSVNICWCFEDEGHPFFEVKEPIFKGYYSSVYFLKDLAKQDTYKSDNYDSFEQAALAGIEYVLNN